MTENKVKVTQTGNKISVEVETSNSRLDEVIADMFKGLKKAQEHIES